MAWETALGGGDRQRQTIPVVDLFAGPDGLGEGFSSLLDDGGQRIFRIVLSVEKDPVAARTLRLRSFFRQFAPGEVPDAYYDYVRKPGAVDLAHECPEDWRAAQDEAWRFELGVNENGPLDQAIRERTAGAPAWVLIGGPPCQAYSVIGRARMRGADPQGFEQDRRHFLYREYLRILALHQPAMFVMENVKGILSSTVGGEDIFTRILSDLREPVRAAGLSNVKRVAYRICSLNEADGGNFLTDGPLPEDFIIRTERHGIPQARHRVILVGLREDLLAGVAPPPLELRSEPVTMMDVLNDLPRLRSGLSKGGGDSLEAWRTAVVALARPGGRILREGGKIPEAVRCRIEGALGHISRCRLDTGGEYLDGAVAPKVYPEWYCDPRLGGVLNHSARAHMCEDLHRYLFAACWAKVRGNGSPTLKVFPPALRPRHRNIEAGCEGNMFSDRFRVQLADRPSTTITSHIFKDGHYFIHPDPNQCRSLTVREVA